MANYATEALAYEQVQMLRSFGLQKAAIPQSLAIQTNEAHVSLRFWDFK